MPATAHNPLRIAVVGCGPIGLLHARAIAGSPRAALVALCDRDAERLARAVDLHPAAGYSDVERMLAAERIDALTIATPDHSHVEPALAAIAAGCDVFCEKPLADNVLDARRVVRAASERGVRLGVDYNRRFGFGYRTARRLLDDGAIGQLQSCLVRVSDRTPPPEVACNRHVIFTPLLTHHLDLLRWFGGEVRQVYAIAGDAPPQAIARHVSLSLVFASGATGTLVADYRDEQTRTAERMELGGTLGTLLVDDVTRRAILTRADPDHRETFEPNPFARAEAFYDSIVDHVQVFIERAATGEQPPVTGHDALASLLIAAAAVESLETAQAVEVPTA